MSRVYRFIEYRRAIWFTTTGNLETYLREALVKAPNSTDRIVTKADDTSIMANEVFDTTSDGIFLQMSKYIDGQPVGVLPMTGTASASLAERSPGNAENYLDDSFFALVWGNHIVTLNAGKSAASFRNYITGLFQNLRLSDEYSKFDIVRIASADKLRKINSSGGVDKFHLDLAINAASASYLDQEARTGFNVKTLKSGIANIGKSIFGSDHPSSQLANSNKGGMRLTINVPSTDNLTAKEGLNAIGAVLADDEDADDYLITLRNGDTIKPSEISAKKRIRVTRFGNTFDLNEVKAEMGGYLNALKTEGQTEI